MTDKTEQQELRDDESVNCIAGLSSMKEKKLQLQENKLWRGDIFKKKFEKSNNSLVVKINQMQIHYFGKKKDCKSAKIDNTTERF